jgi:hypothetical protein
LRFLSTVEGEAINLFGNSRQEEVTGFQPFVEFKEFKLPKHSM